MTNLTTARDSKVEKLDKRMFEDGNLWTDAATKSEEIVKVMTMQDEVKNWTHKKHNHVWHLKDMPVADIDEKLLASWSLWVTEDVKDHEKEILERMQWEEIAKLICKISRKREEYILFSFLCKKKSKLLLTLSCRWI